MGSYVLRRLIQAVFTIFGVMLLTFLLFHLTPRDVANTYVDKRKQGEQAVEDWKAKHHMNLPVLVNLSEGFDPFDRTFYHSQFFHHMGKSVTFSGHSFQYPEQTLLDIIAHRARYSLALTIPQLGLGWLLGLSVAAIVAYYRGQWIDSLGVFLAVLGMCIPYLAYIIVVQYGMFKLNPELALGTANFYNMYIPISIGVVAGLGASVRFYRTIILDQVNQDYVRTARAKGVALPSILGKHVLKNCMLPILTSLVMSIPFLIMGSLFLEKFFAIPGLGDLMITSITADDIPLITGLTFLLAVVYTLGLLITDILYAVFDPRIRLK